VINFSALYQKKQTTPRDAAARIPKKANLSFGLGPSNLPALLSALAECVEARDVEEVHLYYQLAKEGARPLFRAEYLDRLHFHANFVTDLDREPIKEAGNSSVVDFMLCYTKFCRIGGSIVCME
jgi:hypothetical protein